MPARGAHRQRRRLPLRRPAQPKRRELGDDDSWAQGGGALEPTRRHRPARRPVRDPDPVIFFEHKSLYPTKGDVPEGEIVDRLGSASVVRAGKDATILALALMVSRALEAAEKLKSEHGIDCEVVDVRSLVPLDTQTILGSVGRTHRLFTVEENPRLCGWGAEIVSIVADEAFYDLDGPPVRITTPHIPLPAADSLEDIALPTVDRILERVRHSMEG